MGRSCITSDRLHCDAARSATECDINLVALWHLGPMSAVSADMARAHQAWGSCLGQLSLSRRGRQAVALSAVLLLPGCETLNRMDYLDQFFDPGAYAARHGSPPPAGGQLAEAAGPSRVPAIPAAPAQVPPEPAAPQPTPAGNSAGQATGEAVTPQEADRNRWVRNTVRQHPWLAMNWAQLTQAQQSRIEGRLSGGADRSAEARDPAAVWDTMGLDDRVDLAFGTSAPSAAASAAPGRDADYAARRR